MKMQRRRTVEINERDKTLQLADEMTRLILGDTWTLELHRTTKTEILKTLDKQRTAQ